MTSDHLPSKKEEPHKKACHVFIITSQQSATIPRSDHSTNSSKPRLNLPQQRHSSQSPVWLIIITGKSAGWQWFCSLLLDYCEVRMYCEWDRAWLTLTISCRPTSSSSFVAWFAKLATSTCERALDSRSFPRRTATMKHYNFVAATRAIFRLKCCCCLLLLFNSRQSPRHSPVIRRYDHSQCLPSLTRLRVSKWVGIVTYVIIKIPSARYRSAAQSLWVHEYQG